MLVLTDKETGKKLVSTANEFRGDEVIQTTMVGELEKKLPFVRTFKRI